MSTLKVNNIQSFTAIDPLTVQDNLTIQGNVKITGRVTASAVSASNHVVSNQYYFAAPGGGNNVYLAQTNDNIPFFNSGLKVFGAISASSGISSSGGVKMTGKLEVNSGEVDFDNLPGVDPNVAGQLFTQSGSQLPFSGSAGSGHVFVLVSQG